jgi:Protein of unknown function (DUF499)
VNGNLTPWWQALKIRKEIINASGQIDDVQMSLFRAVYGTKTSRPLYADPAYYGEITYPTGRLADLLTEIAVRIGGGGEHLHARSVTRLDQGMGGGKSHACVGAWHLAAHSADFAKTELGKLVLEQGRQVLGRSLPSDLNNPHVVVLPCDNMTPGAPVQDHDGPAKTLYERFLWRLFSRDYELYEAYQPFFNDKSKISEALRALGRPVLIIIDEIMDYIGLGLDGAGNPELAGQDMGFLRALFDSANDVPNVALLVVMIASDQMALSAEGAARREDLNGLLERNGLPATVTEAGDFADILRRRLFEQQPTDDITRATAAAFKSLLNDKAWAKGVWESIDAPWRDNFGEEVARCYPFHPMLMHMARNEWSKVTGFQRVRSTIRIFAATVYSLQQRGMGGAWAPLLIGPGDLPLSEPTVREAILGSGLVEDERTIANYRALAEVEIVNGDDTEGTARRLDSEREAPLWAHANPRAAERGATFIFLTSIVGTLRPNRGQGASAPEVKAATSVPGLAYTLTDADGVVEELANPDKGLSALEVIAGQGNNKPARYFLSTRLTHRMLVNNLRRTVTDEDRDSVITEFAEKLANSGPFRELKFVKADTERTPSEVLATAGIDNARSTRLIVLDPNQFSLRNGMEADTAAALQIAMGLGTGNDRLPVEWASSAVYAVVNTQRRSLARNVATEYVARQRALNTPEVQGDGDLKMTGERELREAKEKLEKQIKRAYQHVAYLAQHDVDAERSWETLTFDDDNQTALDGTQVWKALVEREKAFDTGQFTAKALVHNLRDSDYGRPLSEIRDSFYNTPRLPLLHGGEDDLRHAIFDAVSAGELEVVEGAGIAVAVTNPAQVNLASTGLRLARPSLLILGSPEAAIEGLGGADGQASGQAAAGATTGSDAPAPEKFLTFPLLGSLFGDPDKSEGLANLFRSLYTVFDEQKVSYTQGTLQFVLETAAAEKIAEQARALGLNVTIRDQ